MKKIFTSILIITFIISAIHCKNNIDEIPLIRPSSSYPSLPFPLPLDCESENQNDTNSQNEPFLYTDEELSQIRQNLVGRYQGITDTNRQISFDLLLNHIPTITNIQPGQSLTINLACLRNHFIDYDYDYTYDIVFLPGSRTEIIGLRATSNNCLVNYFDKFETHETHSHDET